MAQKREKVVLQAAIRSGIGKGPAAAVRREGQIPAVVYKEGANAVSIQVGERDLTRALHTKAGENVLITLQFAGDSKGEGVVLIKELQRHPVSHSIVHVDFHQVSLTKKITVSVPLAFKGESIGVKQAGGVMEHVRWDIEVECLPTEIPAEIPVEISNLALGQTLHVRDIVLPEGVRCVTDPDQPVVGCVEPKAEEVPVPAEEGAAPAEPEVLKQKKPEEEAGAEAAEGKEGKEKGKEKEKAEKAKA